MRAFFDSDNTRITTVVLTKDYINCERNYFIIFDADCLVHADLHQRSTMLPTVKIEMDVDMKWRHRAAPFPHLAKAFFDATMKGTFVEFNCDTFSYSDRCS